MITSNSKYKCGIYKIVNKINGNFYIGSSQNIYARWANHKSSAKHSKKCPYLYSAIRKYGIENFEISIILICEIEFLSYYESKYLEFFFNKNITYNTTLCTDVPFRGRHHTKKTKKILSDNKKGNIPWNKGKKYDIDIIAKIKQGMLKNIPLKISQEFEPDILKMYFDEFNTIESIALKYNVSSHPISTILKKDPLWALTERRGAWNKGKRHSAMAKLTDAEVREIRKKYIPGKYGFSRLGKEFGVCPETIRALINGRTWAYIK